MTLEIARSYIGRINVAGDALVFGLALCQGNANQVAYMDMVGPRSSVEAVWAKLLNGKGGAVWVQRDKEGPIPLMASPHLKRFQVALEGIGQDNLVLVVDDTEEDLRHRYLLAHNGTPDTAAFLACIKEICKAPIYPEWIESGELLEIARSRHMVAPCVSYGGVEMLAVVKTAVSWEKAISDSKGFGKLTLPRR
jgi:hypothetical protein